MSESVRQLPLPFAHRPDYADAAFVAAPSNQEAAAWLERTSTWPGGRLALWGEAGCGKTHLLHIWARRTRAPVVQGDALPYLPLRSALAIDNADRALCSAEEQLLHQINAAAEEGSPVLLAAGAPPARWAAGLLDLRSRLRAMIAVRIEAPDDELLQTLLKRLLAERQLAVSPAVQDWLLRRLPRSAAAVREVAARLDAATLAAGRAVTRAIAGEVIEAMTAEDEQGS